jgi:hypothetical protein
MDKFELFSKSKRIKGRRIKKVRGYKRLYFNIERYCSSFTEDDELRWTYTNVFIRYIMEGYVNVKLINISKTVFNYESNKYERYITYDIIGRHTNNKVRFIFDENIEFPYLKIEIIDNNKNSFTITQYKSSL